MRALMVGLLAAVGIVLGRTEPIAAHAQGRSAVQVDYKQDAFTGQDRSRGTEVEQYAADDRRDDRSGVRRDVRPGVREDYRRDNDWDDDEWRYYDDDRVFDRGRLGRAGTMNGAGRVRGPQFCTNGRGHPVFGRRWCSDRGFVGGRSFDRRYVDRRYAGSVRVGPAVRWSVARWGDIYFRDDRARRAYREPHRVNIKRVVGKRVQDRLRYRSRQLGLRGSLEGRWIRTGRLGLVLQVRTDGFPLAELVDFNGDGHVDQVALSNYRH